MTLAVKSTQTGGMHPARMYVEANSLCVVGTDKDVILDEWIGVVKVLREQSFLTQLSVGSAYGRLTLDRLILLPTCFGLAHALTVQQIVVCTRAETSSYV